jgi:hypothetical protein
MALTKIPSNLITLDAIDGTLIADDAINSEHIANGAIDAAHMSANSIDSDSYVDGSIDNAHLADDAVGVAELSATGTASSSTFLRGDNAWTAVTPAAIATYTNSTNNRILTSVDSSTVNSEANLTFDGSTLAVTGAVNSTGEMRITNPSATSQLYLYGASGQKSNIILNEYGVRAWYIGAGTSVSGDLSIWDGSNPRIHIKGSNGYVGIGVVPTHHFNLQGTGAVEARFRSTDGDMSLQISSDADETHNSELNFMSGTSGRGSIVYDHHTTAASQKMLFKTGDLGVTAMNITGDGNVGIGLDPTGYAKLTVNGTGTLIGMRASSGAGRIGWYEGGAGRFYMESLNGADGIRFLDGDGSSERMRIDASGAITMAGTLTIPSDIIHTGDTDTKIGFDTNTINFTTGNITGLQMIGGVNYMAGTPTAPSGSAERSYIYHNNASNTSLHIGTQYGVDAAAIKFETRNTTRLQIDGDGTVQIGNPAVGSAQNLVIMPQGKLYLDAGGDTYIQESSGNEVDVYTGGARRLRVNSNGLIFNTDTAAANALDDYE